MDLPKSLFIPTTPRLSNYSTSVHRVPPMEPKAFFIKTVGKT